MALSAPIGTADAVSSGSLGTALITLSGLWDTDSDVGDLQAIDRLLAQRRDCELRLDAGTADLMLTQIRVLLARLNAEIARRIAKDK